MRGRPTAKHKALASFSSDAKYSDAAKAVVRATNAWVDGGSISDVEHALSTFSEKAGPVPPPPNASGSWGRDALVAIKAIEYRETARTVGALKSALHTAELRLDGLYSEMLAVAAMPPEIATYQANFVKSLVAVGIGQGDIHPATKAKAQAVKAAIRGLSSAASATISSFLPPPVREWSELPREIADYRLVEVEPVDGKSPIPYWRGGPVDLPPHPDIAWYTFDGSTPDLQPTRKEDYGVYEQILRQWAERNGREVKGNVMRSWLVLLGHQLPRSSDPPEENLMNVVIKSPWTPGREVVAEYRGLP